VAMAVIKYQVCSSRDDVTFKVEGISVHAMAISGRKLPSVSVIFT
jgi:hypothetical protein